MGLKRGKLIITQEGSIRRGVASDAEQGEEAAAQKKEVLPGEGKASFTKGITAVFYIPTCE